ncbi:MAG: class I SAM-dependent methyltransferase [Chthoniobacterales bacterium]
MENGKTASPSHEQACGEVAELFPQRWLRGYVAGKLRADPAFRAAYDLLGETAEPILDLGCGVGLLPLYFRRRGFRPAVLGLDIDARKLRLARLAAEAANCADLEFLEHDVLRDLPEFYGNIVLFDVLHYLKPAAQRSLLWKLAMRVAPGGILLVRDCPRDPTPRFWATYLGEKFAQGIRWNIRRPLYFPTRESIKGSFPPNEFTSEEVPMWGGGPFNNRMFIFRRKLAAPLA